MQINLCNYSLRSKRKRRTSIQYVVDYHIKQIQYYSLFDNICCFRIFAHFLDGVFSCFCAEKTRKKTVLTVLDTLDFIRNHFGKDEVRKS